MSWSQSNRLSNLIKHSQELWLNRGCVWVIISTINWTWQEPWMACSIYSEAKWLKTNSKCSSQNERQEKDNELEIFGGNHQQTNILKYVHCLRDFLGGPMTKTPHSQCREPRFDPGSGSKSHMLQLRVLMPQLKISHATTKTWLSQINK